MQRCMYKGNMYIVIIRPLPGVAAATGRKCIGVFVCTGGPPCFPVELYSAAGEHHGCTYNTIITCDNLLYNIYHI